MYIETYSLSQIVQL